jgi:hypothetical protein
VGREVARQAAKYFYRAAPAALDHSYESWGTGGIAPLMNKDHFGVGTTAAAVMRELTILLVTEQPKGCVLGWDSRTLQAVEPLLKIKNKKGFKLTVKIYHDRIRMAPLARIFEAFHPVVMAFEAEGASVLFKWFHGSCRICKPIDDGTVKAKDIYDLSNFDHTCNEFMLRRDITYAARDPASDWKTKFIDSIDRVSLPLS